MLALALPDEFGGRSVARLNASEKNYEPTQVFDKKSSRYVWVSQSLETYPKRHVIAKCVEGLTEQYNVLYTNQGNRHCPRVLCIQISRASPSLADALEPSFQKLNCG